MKNLEALLLDFDGVIGRSVEDTYRAWSYALEKHGIFIESEEYYLLEGHKSVDIAKSILKTHNASVDLVDIIISDKDFHYKNNNKFSFYSGVEDLFDLALKEKLKLGVVSGGSKKRLLGPDPQVLLSKAEVLITGDDCKIGKPNAEPYLKASDILNIEPKNCLVIENAPLGISAAKDANMTCVAVCTTLNKKHLTQADFVVNSMLEAVELIKKIYLEKE